MQYRNVCAGTNYSAAATSLLGSRAEVVETSRAKLPHFGQLSQSVCSDVELREILDAGGRWLDQACVALEKQENEPVN